MTFGAIWRYRGTKEGVKEEELIIKKPVDENYHYFLMYCDRFNTFQYFQLESPMYKVPCDDAGSYKLGYVPKYIPSYLEKPLLYWQYIPHYF